MDDSYWTWKVVLLIYYKQAFLKHILFIAFDSHTLYLISNNRLVNLFHQTTAGEWISSFLPENIFID